MGAIRIVGGTHRSRRIPVLPHVRPTLGRVRESLFNRLGQDLGGKACLDLFSGSGALGLESLSRGAGHVTFVESSPRAARQIRASAERLGFDPGSYGIRRADVVRWLEARPGGPYDVVFVDPPYRLFTGDRGWGRLLALVARVCAEGRTTVFCECPHTPEAAPAGWDVLHSEAAGGGHWRLLALAPGGRRAQ